MRYEFPPSPVRARHCEPSMIFSADDAIGGPSGDLLDIALSAVQSARQIDLSKICARMRKPPFYPQVWPGEHYKLLAALVKNLAPKNVIEIGTSSGLSALALLEYLPTDGHLKSFDIIPWNNFDDTVLDSDILSSSRMEQCLVDISHPLVFENYRQAISEANLIFIDAAKDGKMERRFFDLLATVLFPKPVLVVVDDIRLWNMLAIWRSISKPKLDLTSFGHWSGTGLILWG